MRRSCRHREVTIGTAIGRAETYASGTLAPSAPNLPSVADLGGGDVEIRFDAGPPMRFQRTTPQAPFQAEVALAFDLRDADGVAHPANPLRFGDTGPGQGVAWSGGREVRFGRLQLEDVYGTELAALPVPLHATWYDGASFVPHTDDVCTSLALADLALTPTPGSLSTTPTLANVPLVAGDAGLTLSPPGAGSTGTVDLVYDLALLPWLGGDWDGDGVWSDDPPGRVTFGIHPGDAALIYVRERY